MSQYCTVSVQFYSQEYSLCLKVEFISQEYSLYPQSAVHVIRVQFISTEYFLRVQFMFQ